MSAPHRYDISSCNRELNTFTLSPVKVVKMILYVIHMYREVVQKNQSNRKHHTIYNKKIQCPIVEFFSVAFTIRKSIFLIVIQKRIFFETSMKKKNSQLNS